MQNTTVFIVLWEIRNTKDNAPAKPLNEEFKGSSFRNSFLCFYFFIFLLQVVLLTCRRVRTMTSLSLTSFATAEDNDRSEVICRTYWGRGGLKGLFSPLFLTLPLLSRLSPSSFSHSHSHFIPPSRLRTPSFSSFESVQRGAGGRRDGEGWKGREKEEMEKNGMERRIKAESLRE